MGNHIETNTIRAFIDFKEKMDQFLNYCNMTTGTKHFPARDVENLAAFCTEIEIELKRAIKGHNVKLSKPVLHDSHVIKRNNRIAANASLHEQEMQLGGN